jgi:hypothetical protein
MMLKNNLFILHIIVFQYLCISNSKSKISGDPPHAWKEYAASGMHRNLDCEIDEGLKKAGYYYNCSTIPLFDLGSLHHDFYLVSLIFCKLFLSGSVLK